MIRYDVGLSITQYSWIHALHYRVGLNLDFQFEFAQELFVNLNSTFAKSMNLNLIFAKSMNLNLIFAKSMNLNVLIKQSMILIFSNQKFHCESSNL